MIHHRANLWLTPEAIMDLIRVPPGWIDRGATYSADRHQFGIMLEHESFPAIEYGQKLPEIEVIKHPEGWFEFKVGDEYYTTVQPPLHPHPR